LHSQDIILKKGFKNCYAQSKFSVGCEVLLGFPTSMAFFGSTPKVVKPAAKSLEFLPAEYKQE
jgi:hypothetical protein